MSWLAPAAWILGGVALAALVAAHLLSRQRPEPRVLPTARFVPERALRVTSRGIALSDVLLLLLRGAAVLALVAAFAGPVFARSRGRVARVLALDRSRVVASASGAADSARAYLRDGDALVTFDSAAVVTTAGARGALDSLAIAGARGSLSAALAAAMREGARLAREADSVRLVIVSPLAAEEMDAATSRLRAAWPGRIELVRVVPVPDDSLSPGALELQGVSGGSDPDADGIIAGLRLAALRPRGGTVRVRRSAPDARDSLWARERGHVLVHWPALDASPVGWRARESVDTVGAVAMVGGARAVVAPVVRRWRLSGAVVARFADGEPAIVDHSVGEGCVRDVAIGIDPVSDLPLRPEFRTIAAAIARPCGGVPTSEATPVSSSMLAVLAGDGPLATAAALRSGGAGSRPAESRSAFQAPLLALALILLGAEWWARRERLDRRAEVLS